MKTQSPNIEELELRVAERTRELSEVLDLNRTIIHESVSGILAFRAATGECVLANEAAAAIVGATLDNLLQVNFRQLNSWRVSGLYERAEKVLETTLASREEARFVTSFGKEVWLDSKLTQFNSFGESHLLLVMDDILERKRAEAAMNRAREAAEAANVAKGEFLANMGHEIRTPMNAIVGLGQLALQTELSDKQREYLVKIQVASQSLLGILNDILDFSKVEAGELTMDETHFSLHDCLARIAGLITVRSEEKGLEMLYRIDPGVPDALIGDPLRLEQVLMNLLGNAVKFTERGQVVLAVELAGEPRTRAGGSAVHFSITDSGIGLSGAEVDKLFHPFTQSDGSTTRRYGGTGLGLSISSRLVQMMGGAISVSSEPGQGSCFSFDAVFQTGSVPALPKFRLPALQAGAKVLVVDDNEVAADLTAQILKPYGLSVSVVSSGRQALDELERCAAGGSAQAYRLVLLDWRMPEWDGLETARRIRAALTPPLDPAIIILSAFGHTGVADRTASHLVNGFLAKPVLPRLLQNRLEQVFGRAAGEAAAPPRQPVQHPGAGNRLRGARVLLAEDHPINQQIAREVLERVGVCVTIAGNGAEAVQAVQQAEIPFDLVLMDLQMPVLDGFQATSRIRETHCCQTLPIIAMTANVHVEERQRCLTAGMNDHLAKPIDLEELFLVLDKWLRPVREQAFPAAQPGEQQSATPPVAKPAPGLNLAAGLERVGGNVRLFARLLAAFQAQHEGAVAEIREALVSGAPGRGSAQIHMLAGLAGNLGAEAVCAVLAKLEGAVREGSTDGVELLLVALQEELLLLFEAAGTLESAGFPKEVGEVRGVPGGLAPLLGELTGLLESNNMQAVQLFESICPLLEPSAELEKMKRELDKLDFKNALVTLGAAARGSLPAAGKDTGRRISDS